MALPNILIPQNYILSDVSLSTSGTKALKFKLTPADGYKFNLDREVRTNYRFNYINNSGELTTGAPASYTNEYLLNYTCAQFNTEQTPVIDLTNAAPVISIIPEIEINNNVINADLQTTQNENNFSFNLFVKENLYAREKYQFKQIPTVNYFDVNGNEQTNNFISVIDFVSYSVNIENVDITKPINIDGEIGLILTVNENLTNSTITNISPSRVFSDSVVDITIKANENYYFENNPYLTIRGNVNNFNLLDNYTANINLDLSQYEITENLNFFNVTAQAKEEIKPPQIVTLNENLTNCNISEISPNVIYQDSQIIIIIQSNEGYYFDKIPYIDINYFGGVEKIYFELLDDNHTAKISVNLAVLELSDITEIYVNAFADVETVYARNYGAINVYHVNNEQLKNFAEKRFFKIVDTANTVENIDLGKYVISLKRIYCNIENELPTVLECGNFSTEINTNTPQNDNVVINFGSVVIPQHNNNITDLENEIKIFLPFYGFANIESDFCGKEIFLEYKINIISGNALIKLIYNNIVFDTYETILFSDVLYKTAEYISNFSYVGSQEFRTPQLRGFTPYILIKWFESKNEHIYNNDCERVQLKNINGFAIITELTNFNNINITEKEKEILINILSNGVIF